MTWTHNKWDDELHADSKFETAQQVLARNPGAHTTTTPAIPTAHLRRSTSPPNHDVHESARLVKNAVTFAAGIAFQHRLDCIVVFSVRSHRVATDHGKELSQFFCRGTVSEHITCIELSINALDFKCGRNVNVCA